MTRLQRLLLVAVLATPLLLLCSPPVEANGSALWPPPPRRNTSLPIDSLLSFVRTQYLTVYSWWRTDPQQNYPNYGNADDSEWHTIAAASASFTNGFFPGRYLYLYEWSGEELMLKLGLTSTLPLLSIENQTSTHDVGFVMMSSFGHAYRLTHDSLYLNATARTALSLSTRFNPVVGCTRSWDGGHFLVIIDNMMNLELLFAAAAWTGNQSWHSMAVTHANRTMHEHVRPDGSTWHVIDYNATDGAVIRKYTAQGFADWSCWSRGQAWATYGFTVAYRYTRNAEFLHTARRVAAYFLSALAASSPSDSVPYWDFLSPYNSSYQPRDTSAGCIFASALMELRQYVSADEGDAYVDWVGRILGNITANGSEYWVAGRGAGQVKLPAVLLNATAGPWHGMNSTAPFNVAQSYVSQSP